MVNPAAAGNNAWDLRTSTGLKIYMEAVAPILPLFDGSEELLNTFLRKFYMRAETLGFTMVLKILDGDGEERNLTREYGCLLLPDVQTAAIADLRQQDRRHQAQEIIRQLVQASCLPNIVDRLDHRSSNYTVDIAAPAVPPMPERKVSGTCMLFELICMVSVQTRATVASLMNKLDNLEALMLEKKSNIKEFNAEVERICDALRARKTRPPEMLTKLFRGYESCEDKGFQAYMRRKEENYEDGGLQITDEQLMSIALERYKILHDDKKVWMKKTQDEIEFIAMQNEVTKLRQNPPTKKQVSGKDDSKLPPVRENDPRWAWKLVAPKAGEAQKKVFQGKTYIFCPFHNTTKWVLETNRRGKDHATNCEDRVKAANSTGGSTGSTQAQALSSVMEDPDASGKDNDGDQPEHI
jgi:hypothetical protein